MAMVQLKKADLTVVGTSGLCLNYVRRVFGVAAKYATAWLAYKGTKYKYTSALPKDVDVPVWFKWKVPGHVAVSVKGKYIRSTTKQGMRNFDSVQDLAKFIGGTYVGWSEDINGVRVVAPKPQPVAVKVIVNKGRWNVRKSPNGALYDPNRYVIGGEIYTASSFTDGWAKISKGWIGPAAYKFVKK